MAVIQTGIRPSEFWELTPLEWVLVMQSYEAKCENDQLKVGQLTWHNGVASKANLASVGYERWMESFMDPEKAKQRRQSKLDKSADLWNTLKREKI